MIDLLSKMKKGLHYEIVIAAMSVFYVLYLILHQGSILTGIQRKIDAAKHTYCLRSNNQDFRLIMDWLKEADLFPGS